jgi:hypothetical protein
VTELRAAPFSAERRATITDRYREVADRLGKPMSVVEMAAAVGNDQRTDLNDFHETPRGAHGTAYDRRGLLNVVDALLAALAFSPGVAGPDERHISGGPCGIVGCGVLYDYHDDPDRGLDHEWSASFVPGNTGASSPGVAATGDDQRQLHDDATGRDHGQLEAKDGLRKALDRDWQDDDPGIPETAQFPVYLTVRTMRALRIALTPSPGVAEEGLPAALETAFTEAFRRYVRSPEEGADAVDVAIADALHDMRFRLRAALTASDPVGLDRASWADGVEDGVRARLAKERTGDES